MSDKDQIIVAFDLYGTLLSTESIAKELSRHFGESKAATVAASWRRYQLEYTWRLNSMKQYEPFSTITRNSLNHTLAEFSLTLDDASTASLRDSYNSLSTFPDVSPALESLSQSSNLTPVIFSNGTNDMVTTSLKSSPDLGPHADIFRDVITVEEVKCFKPHPEVYFHLARKMGMGGKMEKMWLVSGNPFDIVGAKAVGMRACWVDRGGAGWVDGLVQGEKGRPDVVVKGVGEVVGGIEGFGGGK